MSEKIESPSRFILHHISRVFHTPRHFATYFSFSGGCAYSVDGELEAQKLPYIISDNVQISAWRCVFLSTDAYGSKQNSHFITIKRLITRASRFGRS